jgi:protein-disulfide isomerase-like protein with CxxC motif
MAKRRKSKALLYSQGMAPTKERLRQNGGVTVELIHEKEGNKTYTRRHRAAFASILDAYLWHGIIGDAQHAAGEKFGREYARSVLKIKVYAGSGSFCDAEMSCLSAINGNKVLREAFDLLSQVQRNVIISVCVENNRASINRGKQILSSALTILARHWKML